MGSPAIGMAATAAQLNLQQSHETKTLQQIQAAQGAKNDAAIDKGARDFEAMLLGTWLKQAEQSFATVPGADDDDDAAGRDQMMGLGVQSLSQSLAASGGIGIAKMVAAAMHRAADQAEKSALSTKTEGTQNK
jgi:Rod binding domain-containing protein